VDAVNVYRDMDDDVGDVLYYLFKDLVSEGTFDVGSQCENYLNEISKQRPGGIGSGNSTLLHQLSQDSESLTTGRILELKRSTQDLSAQRRLQGVQAAAASNALLDAIIPSHVSSTAGIGDMGFEDTATAMKKLLLQGNGVPERYLGRNNLVEGCLLIHQVRCPENVSTGE
jgi:hypothetical protein